VTSLTQDGFMNKYYHQLFVEDSILYTLLINISFAINS